MSGLPPSLKELCQKIVGEYGAVMMEIDSSGRTHFVLPPIMKVKEVPMIETAKFERIPFEVEAVQVTEENLEELAAWCNGAVNRKRRDGRVFVEVSVVNPRIEPRNAFVGDWILKATKGFKVYNSQAFEKCFRPAAQTVVPVAYNGHSHLVSITCHDGCPLWTPDLVVAKED